RVDVGARLLRVPRILHEAERRLRRNDRHRSDDRCGHRLDRFHPGAERTRAQREGGTVMHATTAIVTGKPHKTRPRGGMTKKRGVDWLLLALVVIGAIAVLAPFYLVLVNSFKS